ncbi:MAG: SusC/RagA family TonB-linked outer membrane protein [Sphingobacteriales bacterium]|nr:MAG: SusC/RagA family TonB-linked outer membrane protein [Sphingobacteriales bacterium]
MRKIVLFMLFMSSLLLFTRPAHAQQKVVTGTVVGADGKGLEGVTVTVKGTAYATTTDRNGNYSISAANNQTLVFTFVDHQRMEMSVGNRTNISPELKRTQGEMEEVVVVAMDSKRTKASLGYSTQTVDGDEVQETQRENFGNALQGRVAGLTVNQTSGVAGASSQIVLRGFNSLSLDNTPLFVIDGVVADNSTIGEGGGGASLGLAGDPANANRANDYTNRMGDLNPNDIASITILKGPEATALYGSQASSGAIIITTKRAKNTGKLGIAYDNSFRLQKFTRQPETLDVYSGGTNGVPQAQFTAFGPRYAYGETLYNNKDNFFKNGFSQTHNIALDYGVKNAGFRFSGSLFNQQAPIPENKYNRYNFTLSNNTKIGKYIDIRPSVSYTKSENDKPIRGAAGYLIALLAWPANNDIRNYEDDNGLKLPLFSANPNADFDNPLWSVYKNRSRDVTERVFASMGIDIKPTDWLTIAGRFGYDTYSQDGYSKYDSMSFVLTRAQKGQLTNYYRDYYAYNHTINATFSKKFGKFAPRLMVGNMWQDYETQQWSVTGTNLKNQSSVDSNNTDPTTRVRLNNNQLKNLPNYSIRRTNAYFGEASIGYNDAIFLTYSHRFEESSIFPKQNRKYDYPAASASLIMTKVLPFLQSDFLNFWKLRGSVANTARSSSPYANQPVFNLNTGSGGGYYYGFTNSNPNLSPEQQETFEVGTELRLMNSRLNIDATYYDTKNTNLIVENFRASYGTGYVLNTLNVGSNRNQGVEIAINYDVVKNDKFTWNTRFNFNKMWNEVTSLPANVPEFYLSDTWLYGNARGGLVVGGSTTTITAYGYARNTQGDILISPTTGLPIIDQTFKVRGDRTPDFTLGWVNNMSYGRFRLSFLWDLKVGGDIFNATDDYLTGIGRSWRTYDRYVPRVIGGVLQDGLENTATPTKNNISITPAYNQAYYTTMPEEEFIEKDVNWLRLRDLSLNYNFGENFTKSLKVVKTLGAFVTVNDLVLITNYRGADPQSNGVTAGARGVGGFGFDYGNMGAPLSINLGLRANFK